jgi:L-amino acid N-acyltransferase
MSELRIRPASESDLEAINEIYNYYVLHSTCTYQEQPETIEDRKTWFTERSDSLSVLKNTRLPSP